VTSIQRLNTRGGVAPAAPCVAGAEANVPYETDYVFDETEDDADPSEAQRNLCRSAP
jgi:Protein of unknown function (DUF3455)